MKTVDEWFSSLQSLNNGFTRVSFSAILTAKQGQSLPDENVVKRKIETAINSTLPDLTNHTIADVSASKNSYFLLLQIDFLNFKGF